MPRRLLERLSQGRDLDGPLDELCRQEFMYERVGGDEPVFVFKHALTQDVAYDSLLSRSRRELHLQTARALEELYSDRLDEMTATLAYHYARTDLIDESVMWLLRAAERAARVYANAEAILHLDLAARRLQRMPEGERARPAHAGRGASPRPFVVFPRPVPRERRRAACRTKPGSRG